jgi:hypothetical protein
MSCVQEMNGIPLQGASSDLYDMRARARVSTHPNTHTHKPVLYNPVTEQWSVDYQYTARRLEFKFAVYCFHPHNVYNSVPIFAARREAFICLLVRLICLT